jgi:hypothetical protein
VVEPLSFSGPTALVCGGFGEPALVQALRLILRYSRHATPDDTVRWRERGVESTRRVREFEASAMSLEPHAP